MKYNNRQAKLKQKKTPKKKTSKNSSTWKKSHFTFIILRNLFWGARKKKNNKKQRHDLPFGAFGNFAHNIPIITLGRSYVKKFNHEKKQHLGRS